MLLSALGRLTFDARASVDLTTKILIRTLSQVGTLKTEVISKKGKVNKARVLI